MAVLARDPAKEKCGVNYISYLPLKSCLSRETNPKDFLHSRV